MIESIINCQDLDSSDLIVLGAPYGKSFTYRGGAENGPREIVKCLHSSLEFFDRFLQLEPVYKLKIAYQELTGINEQSPEGMLQLIGKFYQQHPGKFILLLGGDHSISIGSFAYFAKVNDPQNVTIVQIDAHPDLRDNTADYQENPESISHACVMRRGVEMGFRSVQVGIRTYSIYDHNFIKEKKLKIFEWGRGKTPTTNEIIENIKTDKIYLTLDIDGIDPSHMPATGTPVPGGLEWYYTRKLIRELISSKELIGADIVEVSPVENDVLTQYGAAQLSYDILSYVGLKNKNDLKFLE